MTGLVILAIDQGTSGTKAVVLDPVDGVVAVAETDIRPDYLPGGGVEQDPHQLLDSVLSTGRRAVAEAGRPIDAVSLANQGETVLAWDRNTGRPLSRAVGWQDRRSETVTADLAEDAGWIAERTGLVLDPYFSAPKMAWLRRNVTRDGVVTTTDSWLIHHLCGQFVTDAATASRSLLIGLDSVDWDAELLERFWWSTEALPRIVDCDEAVGTTTAFGASMAVAGLIVDQQAALLAEGCLGAGAAKCTFGTGAFLLANTGPDAVRSTAGLSSSVAWRARGGVDYCVDGQVYAAGSAVRWLVGLGLIEQAEDLDRRAAEDGDGTMCVPALAGLGAPWWRADATAAFTGMTLTTTPADLILAVLQGVAAQVAEVAGLVVTDLGRPLERLRVDGGLTRSRTLMQSVADLLQLPVEVYPHPHATALGAAALGRLALAPQLSIEAALVPWTPAETFEPQWSPERSSEFMARWRGAVDVVLAQGGPR